MPSSLGYSHLLTVDIVHSTLGYRVVSQFHSAVYCTEPEAVYINNQSVHKQQLRGLFLVCWHVCFLAALMAACLSTDMNL